MGSTVPYTTSPKGWFTPTARCSAKSPKERKEDTSGQQCRVPTTLGPWLRSARQLLRGFDGGRFGVRAGSLSVLVGFQDIGISGSLGASLHGMKEPKEGPAGQRSVVSRALGRVRQRFVKVLDYVDALHRWSTCRMSDADTDPYGLVSLKRPNPYPYP